MKWTVGPLDLIPSLISLLGAKRTRLIVIITEKTWDKLTTVTKVFLKVLPFIIYMGRRKMHMERFSMTTHTVKYWEEKATITNSM